MPKVTSPMTSRISERWVRLVSAGGELMVMAGPLKWRRSP
jgi:hypothetical protein